MGKIVWLTGNIHSESNYDAFFNTEPTSNRRCFYERGVLKFHMKVSAMKKNNLNTVPEKKNIIIVPYISPQTSGLSSIVFEKMPELQTPYVLSLDTNLEIMQHAALFLASTVSLIGQGLCQMIHVALTQGTHR